MRVPAARLLPEPDQTYLDPAATTSEDLQPLAPRFTLRVRDQVEDAEVALDDVAMWFRDDAALPRLHLLSPVHATTRECAHVRTDVESGSSPRYD